MNNLGFFVVSLIVMFLIYNSLHSLIFLQTETFQPEGLYLSELRSCEVGRGFSHGQPPRLNVCLNLWIFSPFAMDHLPKRTLDNIWFPF